MIDRVGNDAVLEGSFEGAGFNRGGQLLTVDDVTGLGTVT